MALRKPLRPAVAACLLPLIAGAGCLNRAAQVGLDSVDAQGRTLATVQAIRAADAGAEVPGELIEHLIGMLDAADPAERMLAAGALRRLSGEDFGYQQSDPAWARTEAVARWVSWWRSRSGDTAVVRNQSQDRSQRHSQDQGQGGAP